MKGKYYCNCMNSKYVVSFKLNPVEVDENEYCVSCKHTAIYIREDYLDKRKQRSDGYVKGSSFIRQKSGNSKSSN